jgi:hypothetical protein
VLIDPLWFHNLRPGPDFIVIEYDSSKADQEEAKVTPKNCYANPFDPPRVSFHLAINQEVFATTKILFISN